MYSITDTTYSGTSVIRKIELHYVVKGVRIMEVPLYYFALLMLDCCTLPQ